MIDRIARPSIFEAAGGEAAFLALATAFHERCLQDPLLEHPFSHPGHPDHVQRLAWYWSEVLGGPPRFTETCGDQSDMLRIHAHNDAPHEMEVRFVACFVQAIDDAGLPADPELRAALHAYMDWATADVMVVSPTGSPIPDGAAVPRWDWDGLVG